MSSYEGFTCVNDQTDFSSIKLRDHEKKTYTYFSFYTRMCWPLNFFQRYMLYMFPNVP